MVDQGCRRLTAQRYALPFSGVLIAKPRVIAEAPDGANLRGDRMPNPDGKPR